jgi:hypothetical protein
VRKDKGFPFCRFRVGADESLEKMEGGLGVLGVVDKGNEVFEKSFDLILK